MASRLERIAPRPLREFRYYELLVNAFVVILLTIPLIRPLSAVEI